MVLEEAKQCSTVMPLCPIKKHVFHMHCVPKSHKASAAQPLLPPTDSAYLSISYILRLTCYTSCLPPTSYVGSYVLRVPNPQALLVLAAFAGGPVYPSHKFELSKLGFLEPFLSCV